MPQPPKLILLASIASLGLLAMPNHAQLSRDIDTVGQTSDFDDRDGDGINDDWDNCTDVPNPAQEDVNDDGTGDICDADVAAPAAPVAPGVVSFEGEVTESTEALAVLTPVGTFVLGSIVYDEAAVDSGLVVTDDILEIDISFGGFCFTTRITDQCPLGGATVALINVNTDGVTFENGVPIGGVLEAQAFSPTWVVIPDIELDHDAGTVSVDAFLLGFARAGFTPTTPEDCFVDFRDLQAMRAGFFSTPDSPAWNPETDFDGSGLIDFADLEIVKRQLFGPPGPGAGGCNPPD